MNRVYKVIWSKAKHCYVVTSEIARSVTKSASSARSAGRKGAAVLAMAALLFTAGGVLGEAADQANLKIDEHGVVTMVKDDSNQDVNKLVLKVDGDNQITMDKDGIQVGKNNIVIGSDGTIKGANERFTVGTDGKVTAAYGKIGTVDITSAGAVSGVMNLTVNGNVDAGGSLKVGNGNFTVDGNTGNVTTGIATIGDDLTVKGDTEIGGDLGVNGNIKTNRGFIQTGGGNINTQGGALRTNGGNINAGNGTITGNKLTDGVASLQNGNLTTTGSINTTGTITGGTVTSTGNISALGNISAVGDIHAGNAISGASASIQGALTAGSATITGDLTAGGAIQGTSIYDGTATMKNGDITGVKNLSAETITTHGDLTVNGKLNMDEINMTKNGIVGDNNVTASTKVAAGEITSYKKATSTKDGSEKESAIDYDEKGTSTWAKATDADGKWNKSILTVEGTGIKSTATDGTNKTYTKQTAVDIKNTAKNGTITNDAMDVLNKGANSVINKVGDNKVAVKTDSVKAAYGSDTYTTWNGKGITSNTSGNMRNSAKNITNKAEEKLSNSAAEIENSASKSITDKVGENTSWKMTDGKISESIDNGTASNKENTTVDGTKRIITNGEGTGTYNQTATSNNISLKNAAGDTYFTKSESLDGEKTSVKNPNGSSTINQSAESIVNFVKNSEGTTKTEQSAVDIKNTAKNGTITNDAMDVLNKGANSVINKVGDNKVAVKTDSVKAAYGSDTYTTWNGKGITSNTSGNIMLMYGKEASNRKQ